MRMLDRRVHILLDGVRYERLEDEARRSGRSVAALIREAIDFSFEVDDRRRQAAAQRLLEASPTPIEDWDAEKKHLIESLDRVPPE